MKYITLIISSIFFLLLTEKKLNQFKITFCDVGQGDATLISVGPTQMLVDSGKNSKVLECLEHQMPFWDKKIEYFVLTHMDADHIGGASQVLEYFNVDFLFVNPSDKKTSDFSLLEQAASRSVANGTNIIYTFVGQKIEFSNYVSAIVLSPQIDFPQVKINQNQPTETILSDVRSQQLDNILQNVSENNLSIVLNIVFRDVNIVLPGDLEQEGELAIIKGNLLNRATILKAGHHGSKSSSTPGFITTVQPEITVISSGVNNAYNHPSPQVIDLFEGFAVGIYQTKDSGELNFISDGEKIWEDTHKIFW